MKTITQDQAREILTLALATGGEFAEVFMEDTLYDTVEMTSGNITRSTTSHVKGAALRIIKDGMEINGSISDATFDKLTKLAQKLASTFTEKRIAEVEPFKEVKAGGQVKIKPNNSSIDPLKLLGEASQAAKDFSPEIVQVIGNFWRRHQNIQVFASDGTWAFDERCQTRLSLSAVASDGKNMQTISDSFGRNQGLEMFEGFDPVSFGRDIASSAVTMLHADEMVGGEMPVVIHNAFGGVILHEACGHSLEATSVAKGLSVFCGKLGKQIASPIVNAVDSGVDENAWGSINVDDEGTPAKRNVLIENGILKSYLVDKRNAKKMNHPITGSSRRESYKYQTTSRMTNTYFLNGTSTFDEIIAATKKGLFAKRMGGGSVNPATGEFNFAVMEGYLIEDGKITKPVRGATLVGSGKDVLQRIDMIANNLSHGHGMCGSLSGSVTTNVGQPTIRVSHLTVGGKGGM